MTLEVGRRLVNGVWVTDVADEGGGGGGSQTLAQVLAAGNDAGGADLEGVDDFEADTVATNFLYALGDYLQLPALLISLGLELAAANPDTAYSYARLLLLTETAPGAGGGNASISGGDGGAGVTGGSASLSAGHGNAGDPQGASIQLEGGNGDGVTPGKAFIRTAGAFGASGGTALVADGAGTGVVYGGVKTGSGAPSGAPDGFLPLYINTATDDLYVWNGSTWKGPYVA